MSSPSDNAPHEIDAKTRETLYQLFSGKMFTNMPISHKDALASIRKLDSVLNPDIADPDISLVRFIEKLAEHIEKLDAPIALKYGTQMQQAARNGLAPARAALHMIGQTLEEAQEHANDREPEKRRQIATALKKYLPRLISYWDSWIPLPRILMLSRNPLKKRSIIRGA